MLASAPHSPKEPALGQLTPKEAFEKSKLKDSVFLDIRSEMEYFFVGSPADVINIPWMDAPEWEINPNFVEEVLIVARKDQLILLICRSGHRSIDAGNHLIKAGFTKVYNVLEGFEGDRDENFHRSNINGWRFHGLPWVQC